MSAGHLSPKSRQIQASGSHRFHYTNDADPWLSFQLMKPAGTMDVSYAVYTSNFGGADVPQFGQFSSGTYKGNQPLSGSAFNGYWAREVGLSGTDVLTGSVASDPPASVMIHLGNLNSRHIAIEVTSGFGGLVTIFPFVKR